METSFRQKITAPAWQKPGEPAQNVGNLMTLRKRIGWLACVLLVVLLAGASLALGTSAEPGDAASRSVVVDAASEGPISGEDEIVENMPLENVRFFKEVPAAGFSTVHHALARLGRNGDFVLLIETDARRKPISDTLLVWVQHHGPNRSMAERATEADLIIACYPELASETVRASHVLPEARGKVWTYFIRGRYLIVSDRRYPVLDFALRNL